MWQKTGDLEGDERNIILTLARIWYSVVTGNIVAKDEAAARLYRNYPLSMLTRCKPRVRNTRVNQKELGCVYAVC